MDPYDRRSSRRALAEQVNSRENVVAIKQGGWRTEKYRVCKNCADVVHESNDEG